MIGMDQGRDGQLLDISQVGPSLVPDPALDSPVQQAER